MYDACMIRACVRLRVHLRCACRYADMSTSTNKERIDKDTHCCYLRHNVQTLHPKSGKFRKYLQGCMDQDCEQSMESGGLGAGCRFLDVNGFCLASAEAQMWCENNPKSSLCKDGGINFLPSF